MVAGLLHLPTATWGGRMGLYLLSTLVLSGSTPFGNMASRSAELNSNLLVQDKPHKPVQDLHREWDSMPCDHVSFCFHSR